MAGPLAGRVGEVEDNSALTRLPSSSQSADVERALLGFEGQELLPVVVVLARESGLQPADRDTAEALRAKLASLSAEPLSAAAGSDDGEALLLIAPLPADDLLADQVAAVREAAAALDGGGLQVAVAGPAAELADQVAVFADLDVTLLVVTGSVVAALLLLTYRSPVLWLLPLLCAGVAVALSQASVWVLASSTGLPVDGQSAGLLTVLVFGVGTDYALLLIARYREELRLQARPVDAMLVALRRVAPAVLASAGTVVGGLLCLLLADLASTRSLGGVGAAGVACAVLVMMTLLPALLVLLGRWVFWPFVPRAGQPLPTGRSGWGRLGEVLARRPRQAWTASAGVLAVLSLGVLGLEVGLTQEQSFRSAPASLAGQDLLAAHYPGGAGAPAEVLVDATDPAAVGQARTILTEVPGVASVLDPQLSSDGRQALLRAVLTDPADSDAAGRTVLAVRQALAEQPAAVGGAAAARLDVGQAATADQERIIPLVLLVVLAVLVLLLRCLLLPVLLLATVVLSYAAALGATALALPLLGIEAVDATLPLLGFVFLVALGVDYTVFLLTRVREQVAELGHAAGVLAGLASTGGVITSAGVVLAATFAVFVGLPLVFLAALGLVVALGVLLDTLLVRSVLVPALALDLGERIWWPGQAPGPRRKDRARSSPS